MASTLGALNPFRYRGYVYDTETGFYYLQSRYYDPEVGRFLNADIYMSTGQGLLGNNMYVYCLNNSIILADASGRRAIAIAPKIINPRIIDDGAGDASEKDFRYWAGRALKSIEFDASIGFGFGFDFKAISFGVSASARSDVFVIGVSDGRFDFYRRQIAETGISGPGFIWNTYIMDYESYMPWFNSRYEANYPSQYGVRGTHRTIPIAGAGLYTILGGQISLYFDFERFIGLEN